MRAGLDCGATAQVRLRLNNHIWRYRHRRVNCDAIGINQRHAREQQLFLNSSLHDIFCLGKLLAIVDARNL